MEFSFFMYFFLCKYHYRLVDLVCRRAASVSFDQTQKTLMEHEVDKLYL